jgi:DNA-binding PadR family transcriptional regulator
MDWDFGGSFFAGPWAAWARGPRRRPMFESGEVKFVVLRLLREKPMHGYDVIRAMEERTGGCYSPSPGTIYPTLQLLEDEGYVRVEEAGGKKVYHITPEGEKYLDEHGDVLTEILGRVRDTVRDLTGGGVGEVHQAFARLAKVTFKRAWGRAPDDPALKRVAAILERAAEDVKKAWTGDVSE